MEPPVESAICVVTLWIERYGWRWSRIHILRFINCSNT
nr:MAG TPA: hypothetical protein [Bacteriophage sp.]DAL65239.1 MAG TPA_asm: hypothetical protein [Caudoviricetes sp.]